MRHILITGSNRGVGFALVQAYLESADTFIYATARNPQNADQLQALAQANPQRITILKLDINDDTTIADTAKTITEEVGKLDLLINNAGIYPKESHSRNFGQLQRDAVEHVITSNSVGPLLLTQALAPLLRKGTDVRVIMISSQMGSM